MTEIGLADVVRALRAEIESAVGEAEGQRVVFEAQSIDLEFKIGVTTSTEGKAGIRFWVLELGGSGSYSSERIQTVKLSLQPAFSDGTRIRISQGTDENPLAKSEPDNR